MGSETRILILGIGKSGTTALMTAISQALSIPYEMEPDHLGRLDYARSFVAKKLIDNLRDRELRYIPRFDKVVFIVRDPRDALVSRILYRPYGIRKFGRDKPLKQYLDLLERKVKDPGSTTVLALIRRLRELSGQQTIDHAVKMGEKFLHIYRRHERTSLLLKYEDFVGGATAELEAYIGAPLPRRVGVGSQLSRVARQGKHGDWKNWFTARDTAYFDPIFQDLYEAFGYAPESPSPRPRIERATSTDYVRRIVNEWRERHGIPPYRSRLARLRALYRRPRKAVARLRKALNRRGRRAYRWFARVGALRPSRGG